MAIKPLSKYILIEPIEEESVSAGGVYTPETNKDKPSKGKVIACGKSKKCPVKVGQTVIYKKWTNQEVKHEGKEYLLVHFNELLAYVE